ncbi:MAG: hypothetical protein AB8B93_09570 [Pseudomonadales bacterium]
MHQELTFIAARAYNSCVEQERLTAQALTPLQVRYIAKTNRRQAQSNVFTRMFRWNYYDRDDQSARSWLWLVDTRFHDHFEELDGRLRSPRSQAAFFSDLGRVVNYVQDVTSPAHSVPVYTGRFWRLSLTDRFDSFAIDQQALLASLDGACEQALEAAAQFQDVLQQNAESTLTAVLAPVEGMPTAWSAFWRPSDDPSEFGEYGPAGNNFGRSVQFRCAGKERCVLLESDPLYQQFALARHRDAVIGTMRVLLLAHRVTDLDAIAPGG